MKNLLTALKKAKTVLILTHTSPDGDALGSAVALKILLSKIGISADCVLDEPVTKSFSFLEENFIIQKEVTKNYDRILFVDCAGKDRCEVKYPQDILTVSIDHHISNPNDCDINILDPQAAATGEILFLMFSEYTIPLCEKSAEAIYTSIYTDTGSFSFSCTTKRTHLIAAALLDYSFDRDRIAMKTMQEKTLTYSKIYAYLIENLVIVNQNTAIGYLPYEVYSAFGATNDDTEGLSQVLRCISGMECGIFLTEREKGIIKGSVRTNTSYDANNIAAMFAGGGHIRAAGFKTTLSFSEIKEKINEWIHTHQ